MHHTKLKSVIQKQIKVELGAIEFRGTQGRDCTDCMERIEVLTRILKNIAEIEMAERL